MTELDWPPPDYPTPGDPPRPFAPTLMLRTYSALREVVDSERMTLRQVATGADVGWPWLRQFAANKIPDPSVNSVEKLYFFLTGNRL